jgi:hypothetical protein
MSLRGASSAPMTTRPNWRPRKGPSNANGMEIRIKRTTGVAFRSPSKRCAGPRRVERQRSLLVIARCATYDEETGQRLLRMIETLEDSDDVQQVYANFEIADEVLERLSALEVDRLSLRRTTVLT